MHVHVRRGNANVLLVRYDTNLMNCEIRYSLWALIYSVLEKYST